MQFIDIQAQYRQLKAQIDARIHRVLDHGRYILGPEVGELEERLADFVGVKQCVGVSSGTDALLVAMMALEIGPGDEVITTPFTFIATGEMIALLGAKPVFVDIDLRTYNIDPDLIEAAITPRTRAITTRMRQISVYGQDRRCHHPRIGINGRLDTIQAEVLLAKLDVFPKEVDARGRLGQRYTELLADVVGTPYIEPSNTSVYAQYIVQDDERDMLTAQLGPARPCVQLPTRSTQ